MELLNHTRLDSPLTALLRSKLSRVLFRYTLCHLADHEIFKRAFHGQIFIFFSEHNFHKKSDCLPFQKFMENVSGLRWG